jgi:hypothetical protein
LQEQTLKSNRKVSFISAKPYSEWRLQQGREPVLREGDDLPPERLLQAVWYHQRLRRDRLQTGDGQSLRVWHPGFWNHEAGPDFKGAVVQFGTHAPCTGDVEIDLVPGGWQGHGHAVNPNYRNVVLHVVWEAPRKPAGTLPTLALKPVLDAPLPELNLWLGGESAGPMPGAVRGQCGAPLKGLPAEALDGLLRQAARTRLEAKAAQFAASARQTGWEQALREGMFAALGYKQNVWPMRRLAELLPSLMEHEGNTPLSVLALQARLLGAGGLLPAELTRNQAGSDDYLRRVWDQWWRERERFAEDSLPRSLWRFHGLRPANHPQRRLALAAHWLAAGDLPTRLERWLAVPLTGSAVMLSLLEILTVEADDFWSWHWTFRSARMAKPQPLLGATRATDLAMNVILPWFWARATAGQNDTLRQVAEHRYLAWPAAQDNAVLRLARERLLGGARGQSFKTAAAQQGLLQIVRDFCSHSNSVCADCRFPELVRAIQV